MEEFAEDFRSRQRQRRMKFHAKQALGVLRPRKRMKKSRKKECSSSISRLLGGGGAGDGITTIDSLPDSLISCILSKIRDAEAVAMASLVCRRWNACARYVEALSFDTGIVERPQEWTKDGVALGWIRILQRAAALRELCMISSGCAWDFNREMYILMCICHACSDLEVLSLDLNMTIRPVFLDTLSTFKKLAILRFGNYDEVVDFFPGVSKFESLRQCSLSNFRLTDDGLEELMELCPVLEELVLDGCAGMVKPELYSASLMRLSLKSAEFEPVVDEEEWNPWVPCLTITAPKLVYLRLEYVEEVVFDGTSLVEFHACSRVKPFFKHLPNLRILKIGWCSWPLDTLLQLLQLGMMARDVNLSLFFDPIEMRMAEDVFHSMTQVETLEVAGDVYKMLLYSGSNFCFPQLKRLYLWINFSDTSMVEFLLKSSPVLQVMHIYISQLDAGERCCHYLRNLLKMQLAFPQVTIDLCMPRVLGNGKLDEHPPLDTLLT